MSEVRSFVQRATLALGFDEELSDLLEIVTAESTVNAMRHGNGFDRSKRVSLSIYFDCRMIEIVVEDEGKGFDLEQVPDPTEVDNRLKPGGRGILIMRSFMDEVELLPTPGGGQRLRMVKTVKRGGSNCFESQL